MERLTVAKALPLLSSPSPGRFIWKLSSISLGITYDEKFPWRNESREFPYITLRKKCLTNLRLGRWGPPFLGGGSHFRTAAALRLRI